MDNLVFVLILAFVGYFGWLDYRDGLMPWQRRR